MPAIKHTNSGSVASVAYKGPNAYYLTNTGTIGSSTGATAVYIEHSATVLNSGSILANYLHPEGIDLRLTGGANVTNQAGGVIQGWYGIMLSGGAGTVANAGQVQADTRAVYSLQTLSYDAGVGVWLQDGGAVTNGSAARISGFGGVELQGGTGSIDNSGTIAGSDGQLPNRVPGGRVGGFGVYLKAGGDVTNASSGLISGNSALAVIDDTTISNDGTIAGFTNFQSSAILALGSATITNAPGALLTGDYTVYDLGGALDITNEGTIAGGPTDGVAVLLERGGTILNAASGVIVGSLDINAKYLPVTVTNAGTITRLSNAAVGAGINIFAGGLIDNEQGGIISGVNSGVSVLNAFPSLFQTSAKYFGFASGTIINSGSISAGVAAGVISRPSWIPLPRADRSPTSWTTGAVALSKASTG